MNMKNILLILLVAVIFACSQDKTEYSIGVSQCSDDEWRTQMNEEMYREALFYPNLQITTRSAKDNNQKQISDIEQFIKEGVDLLIIAPNEAKAIAPVIEKAYNNGIPVVLVDRKINSDKYTSYIGADNYDMGRKIGTYITDRTKGHAKIVELTGLKGSTPALDRHKGLMDELKKSKDIEVIASVDAGWFKESAKIAFDSILNNNEHIDVVFAHNDRMAAGAYEAAKAKGREKEMLFIGVDALVGKGYGVEQVVNGIFDATFIYPTGGDKVIELAMNILQGKPYQRENKLSAALVNKANARIMQMQTEHINTLSDKIGVLDRQLDTFLARYSTQRMFLFACLIILILVCILLVIVVKAFWTKTRMNNELSEQKKQLEEQRNQLINLSTQLKEATQAKLAFFTNVSHDFRTPLTLIADPVNRLMESKDMNKDERFLLNIVHKNVVILLRLINQILDFRKFEEGKLDMHLSEFRINERIKDWADSFCTLAHHKHIHFKIDIENEEQDYSMIADAEKMERITYNLLSNAFKFTPENGKINVSISIFNNTETDNDKWLRFIVSDTGIGVSAEHAKHLFDSFYQAHVHYAGSGIGLALVKAFVEMHKGHISVRSTEDKGTSFTVEMPMKQQESIPEYIEEEKAQPAFKYGAILSAEQENLEIQSNKNNNSSERESVLIVDDNQDVREYIKMLLHDNYDIIEAANGQDAIKQAMKYIPDAIICDVMMPVMDGMECCRRLKSEIQTSHIPVMMLTAYTADEQKIKGYECGADSYISKPFSGELLVSRLRNLIENRKRILQTAGEKNNMQKEQLGDIDKGFVDKLYRLIDENMGNSELSVEDIGAKLGLGRVQLYRKTKALTGYSPNELIRIARLKKASSLLASTDKTIAEITYEVGFSSPSYFTRCYKDYFGENPTDFLKRKG